MMNSKLERRQCVKCEYFFTIVKTDKQEICYECEDMEKDNGSQKMKTCPKCNEEQIDDDEKICGYCFDVFQDVQREFEELTK